jgi:hypothetical protein
MNPDYCYIEFEATESDELNRLQLLFYRLKTDIGTNQNNESEWVSFYKDHELEAFWWPNKSQLANTRSRWGDVPIRTVDRTENEQTDWDVYSMFDVISDSEYTLRAITPISLSVYHLSFLPHAFPYGGTDSLQKLVAAFGFRTIAIDGGTERIVLPISMVVTPENTTKEKPWWRIW